MRRYRRKAAFYPELFDSDSVGRVRSVRQFDNKIVARYCGFRDADDYYYRAAAARVVDGIAVPTLILRALDDPFIRLNPRPAPRCAPTRMSSWLRRRTEATAPIFPATPATRFIGLRPP